MKKEVFFAVFVGSILGLVVAFGIWRANSSLSPKKNIVAQSPASSSVASVATPSTETSSQLAIISPTQHEVVSSSSVKINGVTKPSAYMVIYGENEQLLTIADKAGSFSTELKLVEGVNQIYIKSFERSFAAYDKNLTVIYEPNIGIGGSSSTPAPTSPSASDSIRQKVQAKLDQASNKPIAYVGTVTDKTQVGFNIKNGSSEIKQVSFEEKQTLFIKSGQTNKNIPFADVAIGDYVAAIGYKSSTGVLEATRVLITGNKDTVARRIFVANATKVTRNQINLKPVAGIDQQEIILKPATSYSIEQLASDNTLTTKKFVDIFQNDVLIIAGTWASDTLTPSSVFIIQSNKVTPTPKATSKPASSPR